MDIRIPIVQAILLVLLAITISIGSNIINTNPIPWFATKLSVADNIDTTTNEPILVAVSLSQAKSFFDDEILFVDARDEGYYEAGHIQGAMKNLFLMELVFIIEEKQSKDKSLVV